MRRLHLVLLALVAFAAALPARAQGTSCPFIGFEVAGRVTHGGAGVLCCELLVEVTVPGDTTTATTVTTSNGRFEACVDCTYQTPVQVTVTALCCGATMTATAPGCIDATGAPLSVDVGEIPCANAPVPAPGHVALTGSVLCRPSGLLEPVADCAVIVRETVPGGITTFTRTGTDGAYGACLPCGPGDNLYEAEIQCCGQTVSVLHLDCIDTLQFPTVVCDPCPVLPCNAPDEIEIRGMLECGDIDGDTLPDPAGGNTIDLWLDCFPGSPLTVTTQADGTYSACIPCPADAGCTSWSAIAFADCGAIGRNFITGCSPVVELETMTCPTCPPCTQDEVHVAGFVRCDSPVGQLPMPNCPVTIQGVGCGSLAQVTTDANGFYSTCLPCAGCTEVLVTAGCCGVTGLAPVSCGGEAIVNLVCPQCPVANPCSPDQRVQGTVTCVEGGGVEPVAGCTVRIDCPGAPGYPVFATTDAAGDYDACAPCGTCLDALATAECCGATTPVFVIPTDCDVPVTADLSCGTCSCGPDQTIQGQITCTDAGGQPQPVAGCDVRVDCLTTPGVSVTVTTDAAGNYVACLPCAAGCGAVQVSALCCNASQTINLTPMDCTQPRTVNLSCGPCTPPPDPCNPEQTIYGTVTCDANGDGVPDPVAGAAVAVRCALPAGPWTFVTAGPDGAYEACLPCATCQVAEAAALSCGTVTSVPLSQPNCPPARADIGCVNCPPPSSCTIAEQSVSGVVTCAGPGGPEPLAFCDVVVGCLGTAITVTVTTDANGAYDACLPCGQCQGATVTPACCGTTRTVTFAPTSCVPVVADVDCGACIPPRPCAAPDAIEVTGAILCSQGAGQTPLGGCAVVLQGLDANGDPVGSSVTASTDGAGQYRACVPCAPGLTDILVTNSCCGGSTLVAAGGCPYRLSVPAITCATCSPCPPGHTRLQGTVRCRGGGPMAGCTLAIVVPSCNGPSTTYTVTTDAQGKYRLCVPCPCPGEVIRVVAACCGAARAFDVGACGPTTPLPTIFCPAPCR